MCGNWKMNNTVGDALALVGALVDGLGDSGDARIEVGVAPPFTALHPVAERLKGTPIRLVAQDCHAEPKGAFTGEVSVGMLKEVGCDYVLVGHSERRQLFGETDEGVKAKVRAVLDGGLSTIVALGETLQEREAGQTLDVVQRQLDTALDGLSDEQMARVVVAYEPVWAIGTGKTATPLQAQGVHSALRARVGSRFGAAIADQLRIQYGGSVKPGNAVELCRQPDIDGGLIGGASLKADDFLAICSAARPV